MNAGSAFLTVGAILIIIGLFALNDQGPALLIGGALMFALGVYYGRQHQDD